MNAMELIENAASIVWRLSWQAAALALVVLVIQRLFRGRLAPAWRHALWFLVLTRLLLLVSWESGFSVYNLMPRSAQSESRPTHYATMDGSSEAPPPMPFEIEKESTLSRVEPDLIPTHQRSAPSVSAPVHHAESVPVLEAPVSAEQWTWQQALAMMWLGGLLLMSARLAGGYLWFASRLRRERQVEDPAVLELFQQCRELMRVRTRVRLQETGAVETPGLFGLIRLRLLLPAGLIDRLSRAELRHVLLHELAHVRRRDVLVNWLVAALQAVHW
ncbi:MAG TPA: M56 family metallopeptidase, partial [Methylomirabilota bacterium]|nr:M56 family metallopeptidase [Methylomirabilota bacterium]